MTLARREEVSEAVLTIWGVSHHENGGEYDGIFFALGGVSGATDKIWAAISTFTTLGWNSMKSLLKMALVVSTWLVGKLADFVDDVFDALAAIQEAAAEQAAEAGTRIVSKMKPATAAHARLTKNFHGKAMRVIRKI